MVTVAKKKKHKWPKLHNCQIPLFQNAHVHLCTTKEQWQQAYASINAGTADLFGLLGCTQTFHNEETGKLLYLLGVFDGDATTLVHECGHIAFYVCRDVGVPTDAALSSETYCYLLDKLFSAFIPHISK
jgi:hypothetical protein